MLILTNQEFCRIGALLCGPLWKKPLADHLGVHVRTIERYAKGKPNIPPAVRKRLGELCAIRAEHLMDSARDLIGDTSAA